MSSALKSAGRFVGGVVVIGLLVNFASDELGERYPTAQRVSVQLAAIALAVWLLYLVSRVAIANILGGRYAVEALILNSKNELLVYRHPFHQRMLPPGGRVARNEVPDEALELRLRERLALTPADYEYDSKFHHGLTGHNVGNLGDVDRVPAPFLVQRELRRQRKLIRFHYDFIYVLRLKDDAVHLEVSPEHGPAHFVDFSALSDMVTQQRTLPDVLDAYKRVLDTLARSGS